MFQDFLGSIKDTNVKEIIAKESLEYQVGWPIRSKPVRAKKSSLSQTSLDLRAWLPSEPQLGSWSSLATPSSTSLVACRMSGSASCPSSSTGSSPSIRTFKTTRRWVCASSLYPLYDTCTGGTWKVGAFLGRGLWWRENDLINHWGTTTIQWGTHHYRGSCSTTRS